MNEQSINRYYGEDHDFEKTTVDLADDFASCFINEVICYKEVIFYFKNHDKDKINSNFPYKHDCIIKEYNTIRRQVCERDKGTFAALCRMVIWNHYREEFNLRQMRILVKKDNIKAPWDNDSFSDDNYIKVIDDHINKANQHLRNVENKMNTLTKYQKQVTATVTLIHGKPVEDYTEAELMSLIRNARQAQLDISDLVDTSNRMKERHEQLAKDILVYTEALDKLPS